MLYIYEIIESKNIIIGCFGKTLHFVLQYKTPAHGNLRMWRLHPEHVAEQWVINRSGGALLVLTEVFHKQRRVGGTYRLWWKVSIVVLRLMWPWRWLVQWFAYWRLFWCTWMRALKAYHRKREWESRTDKDREEKNSWNDGRKEKLRRWRRQRYILLGRIT